ncbi:hypothetical protein SAMN03159496_01082 [Rhizobium sp. NFR07]|nr:hypothetical protein SAMN03159496_01082 [Rhizobium sp. NFR07]
MTQMKTATASNLINPNTEDLIRRLADEAGGAPIAQGLFERLSFRLALPLSMFISVVSAFAVVTFVIGPRPELIDMALTWTFQFKVLAMLLLAGGAGLLVRNAAIPGLSTAPVRALLPATLFLLVGLAFDPSGFPLTGARTMSIPNCVLAIVLASLPALLLLLAAIRRGAPTRPVGAGALAGLLAGSLGGLAYTIACINDGAAFVAIWYTLAVAIVAAIGAVIGNRLLSW